MTHRSRPSAKNKAKPMAFADYPKPSVAVDVVCLSVRAGGLAVLLYERALPPQKGALALPGGFVQIDEALDVAAARLLRDKAGLNDLFIEQLFTFGDPRRDPRPRAVGGLCGAARPAALRRATAQKLAVQVPWSGETGGPVDLVDDSGKRRELFLDHADIIGMAVKRLRGKLDYTPIGFQLLPQQFTLRALQDVHEAILGETLNKDSFRRRMLASGLLEATGEHEQDVGHRPAELYRFVRRSAV
jgi:8-oxo-dGTP diphosphatase